MSYRKDYWREALMDSLENVGIIITFEQADKAADSLVIWAENSSQAFGSDSIPNPHQTEVERLTKELRKAREQHEEQLASHRQAILRAARIDPSKVNRIEVRPDGRFFID